MLMILMMLLPMLSTMIVLLTLLMLMMLIMMLRLLPAAVDDDELGGFSAPAKLALPVEFDDGMAALLRVVALVAAAPTASARWKNPRG